MSLMTDPLSIRRFLLAGNATVTLHSRRTDTHFTYKVQVAPANDQRSWGHQDTKYFVSLLTSPEDFRYMGLLTPGHGIYCRLNHTKKSCAGHDAPSWKAFEFLLSQLSATADHAHPLKDGFTVRHEGKCGRCGRPLTVPESIDRGIGPDCWETMGGESFLVAEPRKPSYEPEPFRAASAYNQSPLDHDQTQSAFKRGYV